jgi:hypothetical protein
MDEFSSIGHSLPVYASLPALIASFALMLLGFRDVQSTAARFLGWAMYLRYVAGALHDFTFQHSPLGVSYNALLSISIFLVGVFLVRRRTILDVTIVPFIPILSLIAVSGVINGRYPELATAFTKYAYLIILILAAVDAFQDIGPNRLFRLLLIPFLLPICLQLLSVLLNISKPGETDGADSYIGGYNHEAGFSIMLLAGVLIVCLLRDIRLSAKLGLITYGFIAIVLANYRTAILSVLPLVAVSVLAEVPRSFLARQRILVIGMMTIAMAGLLVAGTMFDSGRFSDLSTASEEQGDLIKRPELFSTEDRHLMSGRPYIWSMYYYSWVDASPEQKVIGYGAETWSETFSVYAHNTLVSALYELGVCGVAATLIMWLFMLGVAVAARAGPRPELLASHFSFLVLNMATMPMWQIEGVIFYGILCGYSVYWFIETRKLRRLAEVDKVGNRSPSEQMQLRAW